MLNRAKFDDVDWHDGAAEEAGQPRDHAFTHIGLYLAWLMRRGLHAPDMWPEEDVAAVLAGEMTGSDLADDCDGKLVSDMLTAEGSAFTAARYGAYCDAFNSVFVDLPDYGVVDDAASYARIESPLDSLYAEWVRAGRPAPAPEEHAELESTFDDMLQGMPLAFDLPSPGSRPTAMRMDADGTWHVEDLAVPHDAPELESLVPESLVGARAHRMSSTAEDWGSSLLNRALRRLDVRPVECHVASVMSRDGQSMVGVTLYRLPGIPAARLDAEFGAVILRPTKGPWEPGVVGGRSAYVADASAELVGTAIAWWSTDGLVVHVFGPADRLNAAARVLP